MSVTYSKGTSSDAEGFAHCQIEAFIEDGFYQAAFGIKPDSPGELQQENLNYRIKRWQRRLQDTNIHWIKAVHDATGTIVGISGWEMPAHRQSKASIPGQDVNLGLGMDVEMPSSWNKDFLDLVDKKTWEVFKENAVEPDQLWYVAMMAVLPTHRGRGIAQQLMNQGLALTDDAGEGIYLESTPAARKLYERNGFEAIGMFEMPEGYISDVMVRKAQI